MNTHRTIVRQMTRQFSPCFLLLWLLSIGHSALAQPAADQERKTEVSEKRWTLNQQNADIREFIAQIAKITGETFVVDPRIKSGSTVTVISSKALSKEEVYDVFLEVLTANGYTALPKGQVINVAPNNVAKTTGSRSQGKPRHGVMTTQVIGLHSIAATEVIPIIRPLIAQYGHVAASASSNAVIVSDLGGNINRIAKLVKELDEVGNNDYDVLPLKHAWVGDVAKIIQDTLITGKGQAPSGLQVIADERSNRLIIKGNLSKRKRVRKLVATLDREGIRQSTTKVLFLSYSDAKNLADILAEASDAIQDKQASKQPSSGQLAASAARTLQAKEKSSTVGNTKKMADNLFVKADESQNAVIMIADPDTLQAMEQIVRQLDRPRAQVLLEAAIVEVSGNINDALGIQWGIDGRDTVASRGDSNNRLSGVTGNLFDNTGISIGTLALRNPNFGMLVHALSTKSNNNILSTPSLLTLDNQQAEFLVGQNVPVKTGSYQTASQKDTTNPFTTTERRDIGIRLKITPHLSEGNSLKLELEQEVSSLNAAATKSLTASQDLIFNNRTLKTTVMVDDGQTVVIGGLIEDNRTKTKRKMPLLGDIPFLGNLFKYNTHDNSKRNLMLFVRPTIMRNSETLVKASQDRFTKLKLIQEGDDEVKPEHFPAEPSGLFDHGAFDLRK